MVLPSSKKGLKAGSDFFLAYSPEREDPGKPDCTACRHSESGRRHWTTSSHELATRFTAAGRQGGRARLQRRKWPRRARSWRTPIAAVNIALVNELKMLFDRMGIDVWEVIDAARTKPFGFQAVLSRAGTRRALHSRSIRSTSPGWRRKTACDPFHRAGRRDQHADAGVRRRASRRGPQRRRQADQGAARSACWAWPTRRTSTTRASRPASS